MILIQGPSVTVQTLCQVEDMKCQVGDYLVDMGKFCTCIEENPYTSNRSNDDDDEYTLVYNSRFIKQRDILPWMELFGKNFSLDKHGFETIFTVNGNEVTPNALYFAIRAERQNSMMKQCISQFVKQFVEKLEQQSEDINNIRQELATIQQYVLKSQELHIEQLTEKLTRLENEANSISLFEPSSGLDIYDNDSDGDM